MGVPGRLDDVAGGAVVSEENDVRVAAVHGTEQAADFRVHRFHHRFVIGTRVLIDVRLRAAERVVAVEIVRGFVQRSVRCIERDPCEPRLRPAR